MRKPKTAALVPPSDFSLVPAIASEAAQSASENWALWRPDKHFMIDSLNRRSLRELYKDSGPKSHKFSQVNSDNYKRLKMTFDSILERTDLFAPYRDQIEIPDRAVADRRFIDAYFVTWGRKLKEQDLRAKRARTLP